MVEEIILDNSNYKKYRTRVYGRESFKHPAKLYPIFANYIINKYSKPKDMVLDPMCGIGTVVKQAQQLDRNSYGIELEKRWAKIAFNSINIYRNPTINKIIRGNAENSKNYLHKTDLIITSPPYGIPLNGGLIDKKERYMNNYDDVENYDNLGRYLYDNAKYESGLTNIYRNCFNVAKDNSKMVVITKNRHQNGEYINIDELNKNIMMNVGWIPTERFDFKLPSISYLQQINKSRFPDRKEILHENVIVYEKVLK